MRKFLVGMISAMMFVTSGVCLYAEGETEETNENSKSPAPTVGVTLQDKIEDAIRNNEYAKAFIVESHNAQLMPSDPATREVWIPYAEKLHEIYSGHVPVTLGLNEAVEEIKKNIEKQTSAPRLD